MFSRKSKEASTQPAAPTTSVSYPQGGYQVTELPTYHKGKRRVVIYTSDATGKIIKTFKK